MTSLFQVPTSSYIYDVSVADSDTESVIAVASLFQVRTSSYSYDVIVAEATKPLTPVTAVTSLFQVPTSSYSYDVIVAESDTDHNKHTNQASYTRYCCDATHAAVKEKKLARLEPDFSHFPLTVRTE